MQANIHMVGLLCGLLCACTEKACLADVQPIEHLFQAPSIRLMLQTSAGSSAAAAQFAKYKTTLRQQLSGRTPLLQSTMTVLERHVSDIQKDLAAMLKPEEHAR